jgi:hypothetical protein
MPVEGMAVDMADIAVAMAGMLSDTPRPAMLRADTLAFAFAAGVATDLSAMRAETRAMQGARITRLAAAGDAAAAGEVVTGIRTIDLRSAITAWATAIHITGITVTVPVGGIIHITDIIPTDIILTATDTGPTGA